ncbi:DUF58 domain-containing protein [candidate division WOR-3 bacterium]|nr:DUF58 domain-containing protein [candidate division WOR-3 bacterium]
MNKPGPYIPYDLLKSSSLNVIAKIVVEGLFSGFHRSVYKGFSVEFSQHRKYYPGDETKRIDWKATSRRDKIVVKEFEDRTNLQAYVVLDSSASMDYGSRDIKKSFYAKILCASLVYLLARQRDMVGFVSFGENIEKIVPPRGTSVHVRRVVSLIEKTQFSGPTDIEKILYDLGERVKKRSMIIIVSDLLGESHEFIKPLKGLRYRKNEVVLFWVRDPSEVRYVIKSDSTLFDPENQKRTFAEFSGAKREFDGKMSSLEKKIYEECSSNGIYFIDARTDIEIRNIILEFVLSRKKIL